MGQLHSQIRPIFTDAYAEPPVNFSTISPIPDANMSSTIVNFKWFSSTDPDPNDEITYRIAYSTDWSDTSTYQYTAEIEDTSMSLLLIIICNTIGLLKPLIKIILL